MVSLHGLLESCRFREAWQEEGGIGGVTEHITDFQGQIRQCKHGVRLSNQDSMK